MKTLAAALTVAVLAVAGGIAYGHHHYQHMITYGPRRTR